MNFSEYSSLLSIPLYFPLGKTQGGRKVFIGEVKGEEAQGEVTLESN